jgi:hypothetical protein
MDSVLPETPTGRVEVKGHGGTRHQMPQGRLLPFPIGTARFAQDLD